MRRKKEVIFNEGSRPKHIFAELGDGDLFRTNLKDPTGVFLKLNKYEAIRLDTNSTFKFGTGFTVYPLLPDESVTIKIVR